MTVAILDFPAPAPTARELMERALDPHILIGMPHLTPRGLSETWLMKELGHRHWLMLARHLGMDNADFRAPDGGEAYAAICATSLRDARLEEVSANDVLTIRSHLSPVSRTQMSSAHRIAVANIIVADVELISAFVYRLTPGDNHSVARVPMPDKISMAATSPSMLAKTAAELRSRRNTLTAGPADRTTAKKSQFQLSTSQEFNGAGLFYFAQFQALMERCYEQLFPAEALRSTIFNRDVFFFGNAQDGETLTVNVEHGTDSINYHLCRDDGKLIAYARTVRAELIGR